MVSAKARGHRGRSDGKADDCWHQLCGPRTAGQAGVVDQAWVSGAGPETEGLAVSDEPLRILGSTSVETSCLASFFWLIRPSGEGKFLRFLTDRFRQKKRLLSGEDTNVFFCLELREKKLKESFVEGENKWRSGNLVPLSKGCPVLPFRVNLWFFFVN